MTYLERLKEYVSIDWLQFSSAFSLTQPILEAIKDSRYTPDLPNIFKAFTCPLEDLKIVILGQD